MSINLQESVFVYFEFVWNIYVYVERGREMTLWCIWSLLTPDMAIGTTNQCYKLNHALLIGWWHWWWTGHIISGPINCFSLFRLFKNKSPAIANACCCPCTVGTLCINLYKQKTTNPNGHLLVGGKGEAGCFVMNWRSSVANVNDSTNNVVSGELMSCLGISDSHSFPLLHHWAMSTGAQIFGSLQIKAMV